MYSPSPKQSSPSTEYEISTFRDLSDSSPVGVIQSGFGGNGGDAIGESVREYSAEMSSVSFAMNRTALFYGLELPCQTGFPSVIPARSSFIASSSSL